MKTKADLSDSWSVDEQMTHDLQLPSLQVRAVTSVSALRPSPAELEDMSEFERARHTSKTWSMGQDQSNILEFVGDG